ncbi:MAG: hypothetical protein WED34_12860 [Planctomycetales bacterium]
MPTQVCRANCPEGTFLRTAGIEKQWVTSSGYMSCVSPSGKFLGHAPSAAVLEKFRELPAADRKLVAVLPELTAAEEYVPAPPEGGLVLKVHARYLSRDEQGELRYAKKADFPLMSASSAYDLFLQPNTEYMWLTAEEWKSLIPEKPVQGQKLPVFPAITERIARFHLNPRRAMTSENGILRKGDVKRAEMSLVVDDVTPERVRLIVEGFIHWGTDFDAAKATTPNGPLGYGFETPVHGVLEYDRKAQAITRFDMALPGNVWGRWGDANNNSLFSERPGRTPFGFAFELATGDSPTNRIPPGGNGERAFQNGYFATGE